MIAYLPRCDKDKSRACLPRGMLRLGVVRRRAMSVKIFANIHRDTAALAIWRVTWPPWLMAFAPILMSSSRRLVSDHRSAILGIASAP
jgi:hypothetical protein